MAHAWYGGLAALHLYFYSDPHDSVFRTIGFALYTGPTRPTDRSHCGKTKMETLSFVRTSVYEGNTRYFGYPVYIL